MKIIILFALAMCGIARVLQYHKQAATTPVSSRLSITRLTSLSSIPDPVS